MERFLPIGPFKGLGHRGIEIVHKSQHSGLQIRNGGETGALQKLTNQNTEPHLNLIHPGGMFRRVVEHNPMAWVSQKCHIPLQSVDGSPRLPLFQNGACPFPCTPLLSVLVLVTHAWR